MNIIKMMFLVFVFTSLRAGIIIDYDKKICTANCGNDKKCNLVAKVCDYSMTTISDTMDSETIKRFTQYAGSAIYVAGKALVKTGVISDVSKFHKNALFYFGQHMKIIGNILRKNGGILVPDGTVKAFDKISIVEFAIDTTYDIISNEIIEHYDHKACSKIRALPGIHDNASDNTIKQALKWTVKLAYNDLKATIFYGLGRLDKAAGAGVVDNSLLLKDIMVKTVSARDEYFKSKIALAMSKARGKILDLYWKYEGPYLRLRETIKDEKKLKKEILQKFLLECQEIQLSFSETHVLFRDNLNQELKNRCNYYYFRMINNNNNKKYMLSNALTNFSRDRYNKMIEYYFHQYDWEYYKKLYDVYNFDPQTGYSKNSVNYKYIKRAYAYGVNYYSYGKFINYAGEYGSIIEAAKDIRDALKYHFGVKKTYSKIISDTGYSSNTKLTRHIYGKMLVDNFGLNNINLTWNQNATYEQMKKRIEDSDAILTALEILPKYNSKSIYNMRIKYYQMLQMIADTLDVVTCGHKGCSYEEILKGEK